MHQRTGLQLAILRPQTHGAAQIGALAALLDAACGILPLGNQTHYRVSAGHVELGRVGVGPTYHVTGVLDHCHLHAEADTQVRDLVLAGVLHGLDLAFHATQTEAARHQDGIDTFEQRGALVLDVFGVDITQVDLGAVLDAGVTHRLDQRLVRIEQFHVLANHGDGDFFFRVELGIDHAIPLGQIGAATLQAETLDDEVVQTLGMQHARNFVDGVDVFQADHRTLFDVGEQGDLAARGHIDRMVGAAHQHVRLQANGAQLLDRMLSRLGLGLAGSGDIRHQSQVHQHGALGAHFHTQLANGFEERLRLDIADGATNFHQGHVGIAGTLDDATLDLVGDVRNDLNGRAQVITTALLAQHIFVHPTGGEVVALAHRGTDEALVVAQVEVGLGAVVGDEHLTVLERAHGARIDVDIRVQLEHGDLQAPRLQDGRQ